MSVSDFTTEPATDPSTSRVDIANGALLLSAYPGRNGDLDTDLSDLRDKGAARLISLTPEAEMAALGVRDLPAMARLAGLAWHHVPIADFGVPEGEALVRWRDLSPRIHRALEGREQIAIHCRAGLGRSGTLAALILTERGIAPADAIARVRAARPGAIETQAQEAFIHAQGEYGDERERKIHASLIAGAIGDSLGAEIEFKSLAAIRRLLPLGLTDLPPHAGLRGAITDDTQMTLFTAEGLMDAIRDGGDPVLHVQDALLRWKETQACNPDGTETGLAADPRLHVARAPGTTCMSALGFQATPRGGPARNDSKGCGTIMRVAPVAFLVARDGVQEAALRTSALTHGHPTGQYAAAFWAELLADVMAGASLECAARHLVRVYTQWPEAGETVAAVNAALSAPRDGRPETVEGLGGGWIAEEALAIGLHACLAGQTLEQGFEIAVMHGGDSDSTGSIAGNMLGLIHADAVLSHRFASMVECADLIRRLARDVARAPLLPA
jgi:ADP-ribosyl-[dinitrogen reductase] hydrolase